MDQMRFCHSCAAPLSDPEFKGPAENYCRHCTDAEGNVKSREFIQSGTAKWLKTWQPDLNDATAKMRAEHYMKAMPHWAD